MQVSEFVALSGCRVLTGDYEDRQIVSGYTCDLLSHVMGKGQADMAWITVQAHMNVIAVAALLDFACVIIPEGIKVEADVIEKADEEGICVLASPLTAYEISGRMHDQGIGAM